jgi:sulfite dehydrogenase
VVLFGAPLKIELPPETHSFKPGPGSELANGQCLACHSVEYVLTQPPEPRAFWEGSVKKMRDKFGAQIPDDQVEPLVNYLTLNYGIASSAGVVAGAGVTAAQTTQTTPTSQMTGEELVTRFGCFSCHSVTTNWVGPAYLKVAAKYRDDKDAYAKIAEQIHKGGSGKWGPTIMPPFPMITDAEARKLADWILSR